MKLFIDIVMKRIYLFNIVAWNYRKKIGFPVCKKENFAGLQAHRKRGKSARASPTPHHSLDEERSARFIAQPLPALLQRDSTPRYTHLNSVNKANPEKIWTAIWIFEFPWHILRYIFLPKDHKTIKKTAKSTFLSTDGGSFTKTTTRRISAFNFRWCQQPIRS